MARYLAGTSSANDHEDNPLGGLDETTYAALGLKLPPADPRLLGEFLRTEDAADGAIDADEFARGIRRAIRIQLALRAKLHRGSGMHWKQWVEAKFKVGYACLHRYQVAAQLQVALIQRQLPLLENEHQSRVLAPFRHHEDFWQVLPSLGRPLPPAKELQAKLPVALGLARSTQEATERVRLHRLLLKIIHSAPDSGDTVMNQALNLLRQAVALLEKGKPA